MKIGNVTFDSPFVLAPARRRERFAVPPARPRAGRRRRSTPRWSRRTGSCAAARRRSTTSRSSRTSARSACSSSAPIPAIMADAARVALRSCPQERRPDLDRHQHGLPGAQGGEPLRRRRAAAGRAAHRTHRARAWRRRATLPVTAKIRLGWDGELAQRRRGGARARGRRRAGRGDPRPHAGREVRGQRALGPDRRGQARRRHSGHRQRRRAHARGRAAHARDHRLRRRHARAAPRSATRGCSAGCARLPRRGEVLPLPTARERLEAGVRHLAHAGAQRRAKRPPRGRCASTSPGTSRGCRTARACASR